MDAKIIDCVLDLALTIQQIPAPTFDEGRRAMFVYEHFLAEGLTEVSIDAEGNVYGKIPGTGLAPPLVVSAHLDTVFPVSTDLQIKREAGKVVGPGIGDNAVGVAGLFGLLWALRAKTVGKDLNINRELKQYDPWIPILPGDVWLVANVGEEGLGDLHGMKAIIDRFGEQVLGYIVVEGLSFGKVYNRGLSVQRYKISVRTPGGHSWVDHNRPSAVHELAGLVTRLLAIPLPEQPRSILNVGVIAGGTTVNTIAAEAHLELDLRSEEPGMFADLAGQVESLVNESNRTDVQVTAEVIGQRPAGVISADHPLVRLVIRCLEAVGITPSLNIGSTDANFPLSRSLPAICLGLTTGGGAHSLDEYINIQPLGQGLEQLVAVVEGVYQVSFNNFHIPD